MSNEISGDPTKWWFTCRNNTAYSWQKTRFYLIIAFLFTNWTRQCMFAPREEAISTDWFLYDEYLGTIQKWRHWQGSGGYQKGGRINQYSNVASCIFYSDQFFNFNSCFLYHLPPTLNQYQGFENDFISLSLVA